MNAFNNHLRQVVVLSVITLIGILIVKHLYIFLPGILGAATLYILSKKSFSRLTEKKKWPRGWTALLYILAYTIIICLPVYLAVVMLLPKVVELFNNPVPIVVAVKSLSEKIEHATGFTFINGENLQAATKNLASRLPSFLTGTANFITNLLLMFFVLYYMLIHGNRMESYLNDFIPLKERNRKLLSSETHIMIQANAIGIPLLAIIQGMVAALGYFIFGIKDYGVWGFLTGVASLIPIVGTGLIWVPLTVYLLASGSTWQGVGLGIYSLVITGNIDYIVRITLLKKIGDVHPLVTILGVIVGLSMFGFLGLIFGPLLITYFIIMIKIYRNEFGRESVAPGSPPDS